MVNGNLMMVKSIAECIKQKSVLKTNFLVFFEWLLKTGFTVYLNWVENISLKQTFGPLVQVMTFKDLQF